MQFTQTKLPGVYLIELDRLGDDRGFFARVFCQEQFAKHGLNQGIVQVNNALSAERGTVRGMHYQLPPAAEVKMVRCVRGSIYDVALDLRADSPTFGQWFATELSADNRRMLYIPEGFAHGLMTLEDDTEVMYFVTAPYSSELERGVRFDDPQFAIQWPMTPTVISDKDRSLGDFDPAWHLPDTATQT